MNKSSSFDLPSFFLSAPAPCPYLPNREERKLFTFLVGPEANALNYNLAQAGFRRSQSIAYRPACEDCQACQSVRIVASKFVFSRGQKRTAQRNRHLTAEILPPLASLNSGDEQYDLLSRYLRHRHPHGDMAAMSKRDYAAMIEETHVDTHIVAYRSEGVLVACALVDRLADGLSLVYSFFEPSLARQSLGNFIILDHIVRARAAKLPYIYLGYLVANSPKMAYKMRFQPLEKLTQQGWKPYETKNG